MSPAQLLRRRQLRAADAARLAQLKVQAYQGTAPQARVEDAQLQALVRELEQSPDPVRRTYRCFTGGRPVSPAATRQTPSRWV